MVQLEREMDYISTSGTSGASTSGASISGASPNKFARLPPIAPISKPPVFTVNPSMLMLAGPMPEKASVRASNPTNSPPAGASAKFTEEP